MPQRRKPSQRRSQERVALILCATAEILQAQGIAAVTTNSIARQAGIPVSSIYQYFPNKVAILAALYRDYLAKIEEVMDAFDTPERLALPWREYFTESIEAVFTQEIRDRINRELDIGLDLFPELMEIEWAHQEKVAERLTETLRQLGSKWSIEKLRRLARFIYEINTAAWHCQAQPETVNSELLEWQTAAMLAVVERCMES